MMVTCKDFILPTMSQLTGWKERWWKHSRDSYTKPKCAYVLVTCDAQTFRFEPHHMHSIEAAYCYRCLDITWSILVYVCQCVSQDHKTCKNGWTKTNAATRSVDLWGSKEPCVWCGPDLPTWRGTLGRHVRNTQEVKVKGWVSLSIYLFLPT